VISDRGTNHDIARIQFEVDGARRSRKDDSRRRKVIQQQCGGHCRVYFSDARLRGDDARAVDDSRRKSDSLNACNCGRFEPCFDRRDLAGNPDHRNKPAPAWLLLCDGVSPRPEDRQTEENSRN
jgi:hypothetical protein